MGNPVITRLGRHQLWYRKWYTDNNPLKTIKILSTFDKIVESYLNYGLTFNSNIFLHNYWYKTKLNTKNNNNNIYFRRHYYEHRTLTIEHTYLIRNKTPEYFPLRVYILKYLKWVIMSVQWFKPLKATKLYKQSFNNTKQTLISKYGGITKKNKNKLRVKILILLLNNKRNNKLSYIF
jgi:hypothetical protein